MVNVANLEYIQVTGTFKRSHQIQNNYISNHILSFLSFSKTTAPLMITKKQYIPTMFVEHLIEWGYQIQQKTIKFHSVPLTPIYNVKLAELRLQQFINNEWDPFNFVPAPVSLNSLDISFFVYVSNNLYSLCFLCIFVAGETVNDSLSDSDIEYIGDSTQSICETMEVEHDDNDSDDDIISDELPSCTPNSVCLQQEIAMLKATVCELKQTTKSLQISLMNAKEMVTNL